MCSKRFSDKVGNDIRRCELDDWENNIVFVVIPLSLLFIGWEENLSSAVAEAFVYFSLLPFFNLNQIKINESSLYEIKLFDAASENSFMLSRL